MCTAGEICFGAELPVVRECSWFRNVTGKRRYCSPIFRSIRSLAGGTDLCVSV